MQSYSKFSLLLIYAYLFIVYIINGYRLFSQLSDLIFSSNFIFSCEKSIEQKINYVKGDSSKTSTFESLRDKDSI